MLEREDGKRERSKVFQGSQKHFTCYYREEGCITFAFLQTLFPDIVASSVRFLPEGTYERNGAIKHITFKKVCGPVLNVV